MESLQKFALLQEASEFDVEETPRLLRRGTGQKERCYRIDGVSIPITHASLPAGGTIPLLKAMMTSACERDCHYCAFRAGRNTPRYTFEPDELADVFIRFHQLGIAKGLFLSTGIINGGVQSESRLLDVVAILRRKKNFTGYIHIKIMPGAERDQVYQAMLLADRVSVNLEAPSAARLRAIAPRKDFEKELFQRLLWMDEIRRTQSPEKAWRGRWPSSTTQFVVGPAGESDIELLHASDRLFHDFQLSRTYFMAFRPQIDTPLENHPAEDPLRQVRLYQASFLLRDYGYQFEDLAFTDTGALPLHRDPKIVAAELLLQDQPVGINTAPRELLLRVPGIGPRSVERILRERRYGRIQDLSSLARLGVSTARAAPYLHFNGSRPSYQLPLNLSFAS